MMHGLEKSDPAVVAMKPANKAGPPAAEWVEPRVGTKGNTGHPRTRRTQCRGSVSPGLERVRQAARQRKKEKFTALVHHVTVDLLRDAFLALKRRAAPGVDGVGWVDYEAGLEGNLQALHQRLHRGTYRAQPVRRRFIPKPDGRQRPLGITALEDKIVQRAVVTLLNEIYEEDFLGFSCGFRPGRSQHDALDALAMGIHAARVNWILDADIRSFFDQIDQQWLMRFLEHRVGDERILRLVSKWLEAGVLEEHRLPCNATQIGRFRRALGEDGLEQLLKATVDTAIAIQAVKPKDLERVIVDTTVQEKAIAHPVDSRLLEIARHKIVSAAKRAGIQFKQTFAKEGKELRRQAGGYAECGHKPS